MIHDRLIGWYMQVCNQGLKINVDINADLSSVLNVMYLDIVIGSFQAKISISIFFNILIIINMLFKCQISMST